jgi:hypothetical protein
MLLQTKVDIEKAPFSIRPKDKVLFVGSCFADKMGQHMTDDMFLTTVNPYGVMYNPASVMHTVERVLDNEEGNGFDVAVITLGTNHVYILNETGEIVDNCQKRPQRLFTEKELTMDECTEYLCQAVLMLRKRNENTKVILTVSPIRYAKYGFHESQLSKATLLLATREMEKRCGAYYFPAYEIVNDELRDYRFYAPDMLHPSEQAVEYIYNRFEQACLSQESVQMTREWQPIRQALSHRPFNPDSDEYKVFKAKAENDRDAFLKRWR